MAAFLGADLINGEETVWFVPKEEKAIQDLSFRFDAQNPWFVRVRALTEAAAQRWQGQVQIGMTDLGGTLDILSAFRPGEKLLLDLYDYPEQVKRLAMEIHDLWRRYFAELDAVMRDFNRGYTTWPTIFSEKSHYMLQCDFAYMIGPDMFEEFIKPELEMSCDKLDNAFYHLDGPGQLAHLESLLSIESLKGIQWVPGAGAADITQWPDVYRKITDAGKKIQLISALSERSVDETLDIIADQTGRADQIVYWINTDISDRAKAERLIAKYS